MPETPLGQIVSVRSEKDIETLKGFNEQQHEIRNKWRDRQALFISKEEAEQKVLEFQNMCRLAFGGGK